MTASLRPLTLADLPRVLELERELFGEGAWSQWMLREELTGPHRFYVALTVPSRDASDGLLVGYAGTWFDGQDAQVMTIGVASDHQGSGFGRMLLEALLEHERARGTEQVFLEVRVDNDVAIGMYERAGFVRLGLRRRYYQPENVDALTMRLVLRGER